MNWVLMFRSIVLDFRIMCIGERFYVVDELLLFKISLL